MSLAEPRARQLEVELAGPRRLHLAEVHALQLDRHRREARKRRRGDAVRTARAAAGRHIRAHTTAGFAYRARPLLGPAAIQPHHGFTRTPGFCDSVAIRWAERERTLRGRVTPFEDHRRVVAKPQRNQIIGVVLIDLHGAARRKRRELPLEQLHPAVVLLRVEPRLRETLFVT